MIVKSFIQEKITCCTLVFHFSFLTYVKLYHLYVSNDFFFELFIVVLNMEAHGDILREIARLREIRASITIVDERHRLLASNMDAMIDTFTSSNGALLDIATYRERKRQEYVDGLDYREIKKLKISKVHIFSLFRDPRTGQIPDTRKAYISIE